MMPSLELKIPPPIVALLCAAGMWAIANHSAPYVLSPAMRWALVAIYAVLGAAFDFAGLLAFRQSKTTIHPMHPEKSSALVTHGIYRITRNPMYCGMASLLLAWAAYLQSPLSVFGVLVFIGYITQFQIKPEERMLEKLFGDDFSRYRMQVRRWL
ncbi:MAG: isoprenylcysteine carboxylmethyltransferase family protein [Arenimonas sp.]|nr:isoprenylcysteine carboxylmethyltransferase family protein [Arenimonas sp.]